MSYPELSRGDKGNDVKLLQGLLNKVGAMLKDDGDFGSATERGVRYAQDFAGMVSTGTADESLWQWLNDRPEPFEKLSANGVAFIAGEETGGLNYYHKVTRWPHFPGYSSGITIGVGYDLRYNSEADFRVYWKDQLSENSIEELAKDIGLRGTKERAEQLKELGIEVPFKSAWPVFTNKTLPHFHELTVSIYHSLDNLPKLCRTALVSIVFNRGTSLDGERRQEMLNIQNILRDADDPSMHKRKRQMILADIEDEILSMQRLWDSDSGLYRRRQAEANLWRSALQDW